MPHLTDEDKVFFKENGYLIKKSIVPADLCAAAADVIWSKLDCDRSDPSTYIDAGPAFPAVRDEPAIRSVTLDAPVFEIAEELVGKGKLRENFAGPHLRFPSGETDWELPDHGHLDGYYTPTNGVAEGTVGVFSVGISIYVEEVKHKGGAFTVWPGTHRQATEYFRTHSLLSFKGGNANETFDMPKAVEVTGPAGTVCFWHGQLMHTGSPHSGDAVRMALIGRLSRKDSNDIFFESPDDMWEYWDGIN